MHISKLFLYKHPFNKLFSSFAFNNLKMTCNIILTHKHIEIKKLKKFFMQYQGLFTSKIEVH